MKLFICVVVSLCFINATLSKEFSVKVQNPETKSEETERINVDEAGQTETVESKDQTFMKDFNTGYAAINVKNSKDCFVYKEDEDGDNDSAKADEEYLEALQASKQKEQVMGEVSDSVTVREMTEDQRAQVGQKIVEFCGSRRMVLGSKDGEDDNDGEETDDRERRSILGTIAKKCAMATIRHCARVRVRISGCAKRVWGRCVWPRISFRFRWRCRSVRQLRCF